MSLASTHHASLLGRSRDRLHTALASIAATALLGLGACDSLVAQRSAETRAAAPSTQGPSALTANAQPADARRPQSGPERDYTLVFLLAGPQEGRLEPQDLQASRDGHFANMERLAADGTLLIAGPLTDPRSDIAHRGIFVFDVVDVDEALAIASTDPGVESGAFELAVHPFRSPSDLRRVHRLEREALVAKEADPDIQGPGTRKYVLASAPAELALPVIEQLEVSGEAFFHGVLGGELEGTALVALDALRKDDALRLLAEANEATSSAVEWTLHGWFSTENVAALAP